MRHALADAAYQQMLKDGCKLFSASFILLETGNAAARRPYRNRVNVLRQYLAQECLLIEPTTEDVEKAWARYDRGEAAQAGIVDQVSIVVMRRLGIIKVFSNDKHFQAAGFQLLF